MEKIQQIYDAHVSTMPPADRLHLAKLIIDGLDSTHQTIDMNDAWSDDDLADVTAFSARSITNPSRTDQS